MHRRKHDNDFDNDTSQNCQLIRVRERERDLTQSYDKSPYTNEKSKKQRDNIKNATKNFDYTAIEDLLRTVSCSNSSHPTGVVRPVYERSNSNYNRKNP